MKNIIVTPVFKDSLFDVEVSYEEGNRKEVIKLSDYILSGEAAADDPDARYAIFRKSLGMFAFFGAMVTQVKDTKSIVELRYERWKALVRTRVQTHLEEQSAKPVEDESKKSKRSKPTISDIDAGILTLNAFLIPPCACGKRALYFNHFPNTDPDALCDISVLPGDLDTFEPVCANHYFASENNSKNTKSLPLIDIIHRTRKSLVDTGTNFLDLPLERFEYIITGEVEENKTVSLGDIDNAFQLKIAQYGNLLNDKGSRGALEVVLRACELARTQQISPLSTMKKEYGMGLDD